MIPASLVIGFSDEEFVTVQMHGQTRRLQKDDPLVAVYLDRYPNLKKAAERAKALFIVFTPSWYRYTDFKPDQPVIYADSVA